MPLPFLAAAAGFLTSLGLPALVSQGIVNLGLSVAFSTLSGVFRSSTASQQEAKLGLSRPTSKPKHRFEYGYDLATGTPAPVRVRGSKIYACWILNSRPSALVFPSFFIDKRELSFTGDWSDFTDGGGATVDDGILSGLVKFWVGDGSQTTPPFDITNQAPQGAGTDDELFSVTDGWQGRTVLWAIIDAGPNDEITERWFTAPPLLEVKAGWSLVWDPRQEAQDADDPDTWAFSDNHALICLDLAMQNKIRPFTLANLNIDQFIAAADVADEAVDLKDGSTEPRYRVGGVVVWDSDELYSKMGAVYGAGGANPTGDSGVLGIAPAAYEAPSYTLTDFIGEDWDYEALTAGDKITQLRTTYTNADRFYEPTPLDPYDIPGALTAAGGVPRHQELNLEYSPSATQAMRVQKIQGERIRRERTLTMTAPPDAANMIGGSAMTVSLPGPYARMDGTYLIRSIVPEATVGTRQGGGPVSLACPFVAVEYSEDIFAWDAATEEQDILAVTFNPAADGVQAAIDDPTELAAVESGTPGTISITAKTPDDSSLTQLEWIVGTTDVLADASAFSTVSVGRNTTYGASDVVGSGATRYYWVRALGNFSSASAYVGPVTATTA